jgi:hypothetical protein
MFKIYHLKNGNKYEILPIDDVYTVYELGNYEFLYKSKESIKEKNVFIEDIYIHTNKLIFTDKTIEILSSRHFENYFGYAGLEINNEVFLFNIKIEKLKLNEIEDIFTFLWEKEEKLFNVFFSKSTYELDFNDKGMYLERTSKFITFVDKFVDVFSKLYLSFSNRPHTVLRISKEKINYDSAKVSSDTVDYILSNLDDVQFDDSYKGHYNSIKINNKHGLIDKIITVSNKEFFTTYENEIILGSFLYILSKIKFIKSEIQSKIEINTINTDDYADFKDLIKIPFIKLIKDSNSLEKRVNKLYKRYKSLFQNVKPRNENPKLTTVFLQKMHYQKAYKIIKQLKKYRFSLLGEFKLLNISKLSQLYEVYTLYIIIESIKNSINVDYFDMEMKSSREDEIIEQLTLFNDSFTINLFYELKYYGHNYLKNKTDLIRIDTTQKTFYNPDFVIEFYSKEEETKKYYIMDAKYSKYQTIKNNYLNHVMFKYLLNTGVKSNFNAKVSNLSIIFPSEKGEDIIESQEYEPTIKLIGTKPNYEQELKDYISTIMKKNISKNFLK